MKILAAFLILIAAFLVISTILVVSASMLSSMITHELGEDYEEQEWIEKSGNDEQWPPPPIK